MRSRVYSLGDWNHMLARLSPVSCTSIHGGTGGADVLSSRPVPQRRGGRFKAAASGSSCAATSAA